MLPRCRLWWRKCGRCGLSAVEGARCCALGIGYRGETMTKPGNWLCGERSVSVSPARRCGSWYSTCTGIWTAALMYHWKRYVILI